MSYELIDDEELYLYLLALEMLERQRKKLGANAQLVLDESFWREESHLAFLAIAPVLAEFAVNGARNAVDLVFVDSVDELFDNVRFAAQQKAAEHIEGINAVTKQKVIDLLDQSIAENWSLDELQEALMGFPNSPFGEQRARLIAVTETTSAYMEGAEIAAQELRNQGYQTTLYWDTANDNIVCEICGPRHGMPQGSNWTEAKPAHPGCRCGIRIEAKKP